MAFYLSSNGMNLYSYVEGNPLSFVDPSGNAKCPSKNNWAVAGSWSGAGWCGKHQNDKMFNNNVIKNYIILTGFGYSEEQKAVICGNYYFEKGPKRVLTKVDEASREHDSDDSGFFHGSKENINADKNWLKNAWSSDCFPQTTFRLSINVNLMPLEDDVRLVR